MGRIVGLWAFLIVLFVVFYNVFSSGQSVSLPFGWLVPVLFVVFFAFFLRGRLGTAKDHNEGLVLMQQGRYVDALAKFQKARASSRLAMPSAGLGGAYLSMWRISESIAAYEDFLKRSRGIIQTTPGVGPLILASLALGKAINGDVAGTRALLDDPKTGLLASSTGSLAELVLLCRAERWADAHELLRTKGLLLDQLGGVFRALLDAITAFVASKTGGADGAVSSVRLFRETSSDGLKQAWPELVAFVERVEAGPRL
jgi:tetratricopeptide (TPR) repeat protein